MIRRVEMRRQRVQITLSEDVRRRVKEAIYWTPSHPTVSRLVEEGLLAVVAKMAKERGTSFPPVPDPEQG